VLQGFVLQNIIYTPLKNLVFPFKEVAAPSFFAAVIYVVCFVKITRFRAHSEEKKLLRKNYLIFLKSWKIWAQKTFPSSHQAISFHTW